MDNKELFDKIIRNDIEDLQKEKTKIKNKIDKISENFNTNDIQKLNENVNKLNEIQAIENHLYVILGSLETRLEKL